MSEAGLNSVPDDEARIRILDAVKAAGGTVTVADVVARSGVRPDDAERLLNKLVLEYESALDVDDDGQLLYRFDPALSAREDVLEADKKRRRRGALKEGAMRFFRAWTVVMVVLYTAIFAIFIVALAFRNGGGNISSSGGRGRGRHRRGGGQGAGIMSVVLQILVSNVTWKWNRKLRRKLRDQISKRIDAGEDPFSWITREEDHKPSVIDRTWYWLFGSAAIESTPLELEKTLITYVRAKHGLITNADIMALTGYPYDRADAVGTRLCAAYGGDLDITEEGVPIYRFSNLMLSAHPEVAEQVPRTSYLWQSRRREHDLRQNPSKLIVGLNGFNLLMSVVMYFSVLPTLGMTSTTAVVVFSVVPFVFSMIFFALGAIRSIRESAGRDEYERDNLRIAIYRLLFSRRRPVVIPGDEKAIGEAELGWWRDTVIIEQAEAIAGAIRGTVRVLPDGRTEISAPTMIEEISLVERLRSTQGAHLTPVGETVFSSADDSNDGPGANNELSSEALDAAIEAL